MARVLLVLESLSKPEDEHGDKETANFRVSALA
jgi:hypothetical protein